MQLSKDENTLLLEVLRKDEELNAFLQVTNGQAKFALFEKLRAEVETKLKQGIEPPKKPEETEKDSKGEDEEDIVVED